MNKLLVTFFGVGLMPFAPGTFGTIAAALALLPAYHYFSDSPVWRNFILIDGLIVSSFFCLALGAWAKGHFRRKDPAPVVLDEVAGLCLTLLFLPSRPDLHPAFPLLLGVIAFRVFDILKPPPVRQLETLREGAGILADDLMAGIYANIVCQILLRYAF